MERRKDRNLWMVRGVRFVFWRMVRWESTRSGGYMPRMQEDAIYEMIVSESGLGGDEL